MRSFVEVFRHEQPFIAEMAMEELRKNGINCFMQQGSVTGIEMSPVCPVASPGIEYVVYVHSSSVQDARKIIEDLPVDTELLNVKWTKSPEPKRRKLLWFYWFIALVPGLIYLLLI